MKLDRLVDHQIKIEVTNNQGVVRLLLPDNQTINWPVLDPDIVSGQFYLTLSKNSKLPNKEELGRLVLKEILQGGK